MLVDENSRKSIQNKNVTFIRKCISNDMFEDFDSIFNFIESKDLQIRLFNEDKIFDNNQTVTCVSRSSVFQVCGLDQDKKVLDLANLIHTIIYEKAKIKKWDAHLYLTLNSGISKSHNDIEDVHLFGLFGDVRYRIYDTQSNVYQDYDLSCGDYLYIPKGLYHRSISLSPRSVLSIGFQLLTNP